MHENPPEQEPDDAVEHHQYLTWWREAVDDYAEAREQHIRDEEYYDGDVKGTGWGHWTQTELTKLGIRGQPPTTRNITARKVNAICGIEQRSRSEPRALPRTPKDQKAAEIATDALRFIKDQARWLNLKAEQILGAVKVGYAAVIIGGAEDRVPITPIPWKDFFFDPRSRNFDFSDARYLGTAKWLDADVAQATYAGPEVPEPQIPPKPMGGSPEDMMIWATMAQAAIEEWRKAQARRQKVLDAIESTMDGGVRGADDDQFEDRPANRLGDNRRKRVFVIDMWRRDPRRGWHRCVFTGAGKLFTEQAKFIETDEWGRKVKTHPIKAVALHVSKDLWRYGEIRGMRSTQDEVNFRLSKKLHYLATNQLFYEPGTFQEQDVDAVRREVNKPDGVIAVNKIDGYRVEKNLDVAMAIDAAMQEAMRFLDAEGANLELQGRGEAGASGRAILARQQAGLGQLGPVFDRLHDWELRCYRAMWARVQQFWTAPMYVRVTDDKNAARFAAVNGARVIENDNASQQRPDTGNAMIGHNGGPPMTPEDMGGPMLAELDMDIIIDRAPEAATLQAEQFQEMAKLAQGGLFNGMPPAEIARLMITASSLPNKTQLLDMLDRLAAEPPQQQPNPMQIAQLKELIAKAEDIAARTQKTKAETAKIAAEIPNTHASTALTEAQARSERVNATMTELSADGAIGMRQRLGAMQEEAPSFAFTESAFPAAADQSGASGLPPSPANGPPPLF